MTTATRINVEPQPGPQEQFLASSADIVIYGGAAGGGKTWGLVIEPLRHHTSPEFRAVIFRRTSPQITNPGGLQDEAERWYPLFGGRDTRPHSGITWTFPSGATVIFNHMQHEKNRLDWQGAQVPFIGFDELTHFTAEQFFYMLSRNRDPAGKVSPYIRATTNPEPGWVADFIAWWIGEDGYYIPERAGVVRYFVRVDEQILWADTPGELRRAHPGAEPKSATFIPARLEDNPILLDGNPGYLANLLALPLVERERLWRGNWTIMPSGGKVFNRAWFQVIPLAEVPDGGVECRFWDLAATEKELKGDDPDYTAGVKIRKVDQYYYVMDCIAERLGPTATDKLIRTTAERDRQQIKRQGGNTRYMVRWEKEGGASGKRDTRHLVKLLDGFDARGVAPDGDKITRAKAFSAQSEQGFVVVVAGEWNERWLTHMHHQPDWPHDDIMDGSSGAYNALHAGDGSMWEATA